MENINKFTEETGFKYNEGEVGLGRECVGILDTKTNSYVEYTLYDRDFNTVAEHTAEPADDAYHKHPCLAVLIHDGCTLEEAKKQLDEWVGRILDKGYKLQEYRDTTSVSALFGGGSVIKKAIIDQ